MDPLSQRLMMGAAGGGSPVYIEDVFSTWLYTGNGGTQTINNGIALSGATTNGWIGTLSGTGDDAGKSIGIDSSRNVYVAGYSSSSGTYDLTVSKFDASGTLLWQRRLVDAFGVSSAVDSSGNVYVCGTSSAPGNTGCIIVKYNTSGTLQWQRRFGGGGASTQEVYSIAVDSSGNAYICGRSNANDSGTIDCIIFKYNTSGTLQWQRRLASSSDEEFNSIAVDSSGNVYVCGRSNASGTNDIIIAKYNTSGTIQWQRRLDGGTVQFNDIGRGIAVDSSGNAYICGQTLPGQGIFIAKYNTSGTIQWQRTLDGTNGDVGYGIAVDSSGNAYICGASVLSAVNTFIIAKYDTSGTIQWQRILRRIGSSTNDIGNGIAVDSSGSIYITGDVRISGLSEILIAKLPDDGSGNGIYTVGSLTFEYFPSNLTAATSSLTESASTLTDSASSFSEVAATLTDAVSTLTSSVTSILAGTGKGGLVWCKQRSSEASFNNNVLVDTIRGENFRLFSDLNIGQSQNPSINGFSSTGFAVNGGVDTNQNNRTYVSWTFAKQPKFFDVVTYTGDGTFPRAIPHNLGSIPGCIIIKCTSHATNWLVSHRGMSDPIGNLLNLNSTAAETGVTNGNNNNGYFSSTTSTLFYVGNNAEINAVGRTYVAYLFAHNAGGFGLTGTDNVISCGTWTDGNAVSVNLGYEPQFIMWKNASAVSNWNIKDNMRGWTGGLVSNLSDNALRANVSDAEFSVGQIQIQSNGFYVPSTLNSVGNNWIYIAIRRGLMRTPTSGTSVFQTVLGGSATTNGPVTGFVTDAALLGQRGGTDRWYFSPRLTGSLYLRPNTTDAEASQPNLVWDRMDGAWNSNVSGSYNLWGFRRAPGFFDVVCYTGVASGPLTINHNLGVTPELVITKARTGTSSPGWFVGSNYLTNGYSTTGHILQLQSTAASVEQGYFRSANATTATLDNVLARSGQTYVAYLFASCPGVSKVGTYTGTGSTVQVNCGFTSGARFVLIKRTDSTGDWYVWDSARGIIAANDPYLVLNTTAAEVTSTDWIDPLSSGFEVSNAGSNLVNVNGGTYLFLAIA